MLAYTTDGGGSKQVQAVTSYDDAGVAMKVDLDYDQYGNVTSKREYGHQISGNWLVRRRTRVTYKTDTSYINEYLRSLATQVEMLDAVENTSDGDDTLIAKKAISYDDYTGMGGMDNYGGFLQPPGHLSSTYTTSKTVRGNVTGTTDWTDVVANVSNTRLVKYDLFGNVVKAQLSCCNERSFLYTEAIYWSQAVEVTSGNPTIVSLTSSGTYDFNTGLTMSQTNPSSLTTTYDYDAALRNTHTTLPTGASGSVSYNDSTLTSTETVGFDDSDEWDTTYQEWATATPAKSVSVTTSSVRNGWGQTIQAVNGHGGQVNITYDAMGRILSQTNPFTQGGQPGPATTYEYDSLGRMTKTTLPDGNTVQTAYSGTAVTVTDQVERKIKREMDGLGRLVKVTEQDSTGRSPRRPPTRITCWISLWM